MALLFCNILFVKYFWCHFLVLQVLVVKGVGTGGPVRLALLEQALERWKLLWVMESGLTKKRTRKGGHHMGRGLTSWAIRARLAWRGLLLESQALEGCGPGPCFWGHRMGQPMSKCAYPTPSFLTLPPTFCPPLPGSGRRCPQTERTDSLHRPSD